MDQQFDAVIETSIEQFVIRDLLTSEIVLIGGGETVVCGI